VPSGGAKCKRADQRVAFDAGTACSLGAAVEAARDGDQLLLRPGSYGAWAGTSKAITLRAEQRGAAKLTVELGAGASRFTLDGMGGMGGTIADGATGITISDSAFIAPISIAGATTKGIVLDHNTHNWMTGPSYGPNAKVFVDNTLTGTLASPSLTIENSEFRNGDLDGIHIGGGSPGLLILRNRFRNICDFAAKSGGKDSNHADNIQFEGGGQVRIAGNYIYAAAADEVDGKSCATQGITSYDGGTVGDVIEDNVVDIRRPWGIELYSDNGSIVRHNTVQWHADADCLFDGPQCGQIDINRKDEDPPGTGTQVVDNVVTGVSFTNGSTGSAKQNLCRGACAGPGSISRRAPTYVGGAKPTSWGGFCLASKSKGRSAASDGLAMGIRCTAR